MLQLRDYQHDIIEHTRAHMRRGVRRVLIQLATGGGKTALSSRMLHGAVDRGKRVWFVVHRRELKDQVAEAFEKDGLRYGIVAADVPMNRLAMAQICTIQTLANRLHLLPPPDLICFDECHHIASKSWAAIAKMFPKAYQIGLSATPVRLDGRGLAEFFDVMVCGPSVAELIEWGYLSKYRLIVPPTVDVSALRRRGHDYDKSDASALMRKPEIVGGVIEHYRRHADGKKMIAFCASIDSSLELVRDFNLAGIPALHIEGTTDDTLRRNMLRDFRDGKVRILSNVDLFGEGFDCPDIEGVIDLAPTLSLSKVRQRWGRALRPAQNKEYAILTDHVGNSGVIGEHGFEPKHGLPDDDIEWELTGDVVRNKKAAALPPPRICPACFVASPGRAWKCQGCGLEFRVQGRDIREVDGELHEIDAEGEKAKRRKMQQNPASTLAGLVTVGIGRKYAAPVGWAVNIMRARLRKQGLTEEQIELRLIEEGIEMFAVAREEERRRKQAEAV